MLLPLHRPLWVVMVFCAFEKIRGLVSAQERRGEQQLVPKIKEQELINWLLIPTDYCTLKLTAWILRDCRVCACTHSHSVLRFCSRTLIQKQTWSQMISVVCAGNRDSRASLLMEWYDLASKQRLVWMVTLYISDPHSLLAFSMCQWPGKAGWHHLTICVAGDILRYAGCGPASPVDKSRPQTYCNIMVL